MLTPRVSVNADEIVAVLETKKRKLRDALDKKMHQVVEDVEKLLFTGLPNKYLDPKSAQSGVTSIGASVVVGYIEYTDKEDKYPIVPVKARYLRFIAKSGDLVYTKYVSHPYLKGTKYVTQHLLELKPWIESQLEDAIIEAL